MWGESETGELSDLNVPAKWIKEKKEATLKDGNRCKGQGNDNPLDSKVNSTNGH
ncbi:hypothetical protein L798_14970 [Zootermopsis nevadensis]|uniref:Uncharacterized protein n=1 Tax=Zootermopsis nevadensis TaxID=136037 RepID=A0A067RSD5_ZOONE|nr:hypothetical protein L798_14970 [Zootermopsis nevadensis]